MPDRSEKPRCKQCGAVLRSVAVDGLCPGCLFRCALEDDPLEEEFSVLEMSSPAPDQGGRAFGRYELLDVLGRGGMGVVHRARERATGRLVALKLATPHLVSQEEFRRRFQAEMKAAASLDHPHVLPVYEIGEYDGVPYFTMKLAEGGSLASRIDRWKGRFRDVARLVAQVARAVEHAHARGILHRDLKPANILLGADNEPYVSDFGLVKWMADDASLTATSVVVGAPGYLAPEQARPRADRPLGPAADVFSLGVVLYELVTGQRPFVGTTVWDMLERIEEGSYATPRALARSVPRDLEIICRKCLEAEPGRRYISAAALAEDLERFVSGRTILARPVPPMVRFARWCHRRPALATVWFLVVALAAGSTGAAVLLTRERDRARAAEAETRRHLAEAKLAEANAVRLTLPAGRRSAAIAALKSAAAIAVTPEVRDAAVAALALPDVEVVRAWPIAETGVNQTAFDPSGAGYLVTPYGRPGASWRESGTDRELAVITGATADARVGDHARFSADGSRMVVRASDHTVAVWERRDQVATLLWRLTDKPDPPRITNLNLIRDIDINPDGTRVTIAAAEGGLTLHDATTGREVGRWTADFVPSYARWSPDGGLLAVTSIDAAQTKAVSIVATDTWQTLRIVPVEAPVVAMAWSRDGARLAATLRNQGVVSIRAETGEIDQEFTPPEGLSSMVGFFGDDEHLLLSSTGLSYSWRSSRDGHEWLTLAGVESGHFTVSHDGARFVTSNATDTAREYRFVAPSGVAELRVNSNQGAYALAGKGSLVFSRDGRWLLATAQGEAKIFATADPSSFQRIDPEGWSPTERITLGFGAGESHLYVCGDTTGLRRYAWAASDGASLKLGPAETIDPEADFFLRDVSTDGRRLVLLSRSRGRIKIYQDEQTGAKKIADWTTASPFNAAFSPSGEQILVNYDINRPDAAGAKIKLWNIGTASVAREFEAPPSCDVDWAPASGVAMTSNGAELSILWNDSDWSRGPTLPRNLCGDATSFAIAPDGRSVAIATEQGGRLVDTQTGKVIVTLATPTKMQFPTAAAYSPDGNRLAILVGDGRVFLWNLAELRGELARLGLDW